MYSRSDIQLCFSSSGVALIYHVQCVLSALWLLCACDIQGLMDNFQPALINAHYGHDQNIMRVDVIHRWEVFYNQMRSIVPIDFGFIVWSILWGGNDNICTDV